MSWILRTGGQAYAAFMRLLFAGGCPSLFTNRICLGGGGAGESAVSVELMPLTALSSWAHVPASFTPNRRRARRVKVHRPGPENVVERTGRRITRQVEWCGEALEPR